MTKVIDTFAISGRGTVVILEVCLNLPIMTKLSAYVRTPDGTCFEAKAHKEHLLGRSLLIVDETEAFLLFGVEKTQIPVGSDIELKIDLN